MPGAENHMVSGATNDIWRTWLMTGVRRDHVDRRRMRGAHKGLKKILLEGVRNGDERPHAWQDFSGAMIRHAVDEAIRSLPHEDNRVVPPVPSPTTPADRGRVAVSAVQAPVQPPAVSVPVNVPVTVPPLPPLPIKVKPPAL